MVLDFDRDIAPVVERAAKSAFEGDPERSDVFSVAWELFQTAPPAATPDSITQIAVQRVKQRRHFSESERGIHYNPRRLPKGKVVPLMLGDEFFREGDNPADRAALRIDFAAFMRSLSLRELALLVAFASGERTQDLAKRFRLSPGRISQYRRYFIEQWERFTE